MINPLNVDHPFEFDQVCRSLNQQGSDFLQTAALRRVATAFWMVIRQKLPSVDLSFQGLKPFLDLNLLVGPAAKAGREPHSFSLPEIVLNNLSKGFFDFVSDDALVEFSKLADTKSPHLASRSERRIFARVQTPAAELRCTQLLRQDLCIDYLSMKSNLNCCVSAQGENWLDRLVDDSEHFYAIEGVGAFHSGYLIILPKDQSIRSFSALKDELWAEASAFASQLTRRLRATYGCQVLTFEHGMCSCVGIGPAHLHLMCLPETLTREQLDCSTNAILAARTVGIDRVEYRGREFTEREDKLLVMAQLHAGYGTADSRVIGSQIDVGSFESISSQLDEACQRGGRAIRNGASHYSFMILEGHGGSFSTANLGSQFWREVVFDCWRRFSALPSPPAEDIQRDSWNWRMSPCWENVNAGVQALRVPRLRKSGLLEHAALASPG